MKQADYRSDVAASEFIELKVEEMTYSASSLADLGSRLVADIFDHVVAEEAHGEIIVTADHTSEDRDACHAEENMLNNLCSVHFYRCATKL